MPKFTTPPTPLAKAIREYRTRINYTQEDLAKELGCSKQTVGNYENGLSQPAAKQLQDLATLFGISLAKLVGEDVASEMEYEHLPSARKVEHYYFEIVAHNEDGKLRMLTSALLGLSDEEWNRLWRGLGSVLDEERRDTVMLALGIMENNQNSVPS